MNTKNWFEMEGASLENLPDLIINT